ncbi:MAG: PP2C family protein-serine/threonine phosphatase, partial [Acidobacteriota bacterium]
FLPSKTQNAGSDPRPPLMNNDDRKLTEIAGMPLQEIKEEFISLAELQRRIMPDPEPLTVFGEYDIFGKTLPIAVIGGDYLDFIDLEGRFGMPGRMGVVVADAAGHGLVAAMLIRDFNTALYTAISFQSHYEKDTTPLLFTKINRRMYRSSQSNQFISAFYGELHVDGTVRYINAGHYSPFLFKEDAIVSLDVGGPVLGAFRDYKTGFEVGESRMDEGDILVCFTDGMVEAENGAGEAYELERLKQIVLDNRDQDAITIFNRLIEDVEQFSREVGQADDRTVIVIKKIGH